MAKRKHRGGGSDRFPPGPGATGPRSKSASFAGRPGTGPARPAASRSSPSRPGKAGFAPRTVQHPAAKRAGDRHRGRGPGQGEHADRDRSVGLDDRAAAPESPGRRPSHDGPRQIWIYGLHAVQAALANPRRRRRRLVLSQEAAQTLQSAAGSASGPDLGGAEIQPREAIARLLPPGAVHQGAALLTEPLADLALEEVMDGTAGAETAVVLVLDQVTDPQNVGAILRSAAAFGAAAVIVPDRHAPPETGALVKAASGAVEMVPLVRVVNLARALEQLKEAGFWCAGLEGRAAQTLAAADLSGKVALVLGAEGEGLRRLTRDHCDILIRLPIAPQMESLNVSAAAAVALYELARKA